MPIAQLNKYKKKIILYIFSCSIVLFLLTVIISSFLYLIYFRFQNFFLFFYLKQIILFLFIFTFLIIFYLYFSIIFTDYSSLQLNKFLINFLFPIYYNLGKIIKLNKEKIQKDYILINNFYILSFLKKNKVEFKKILVLLPHCLQFSKCNIKVTKEIENCRQCGKCIIGEFLSYKKKYKIEILIATGGTLARKYINDEKPDFIIAVACERDLSFGIMDVGKYKVYGILNSKPNGPCEDTLVDINEIDEILNLLVSK